MQKQSPATVTIYGLINVVANASMANHGSRLELGASFTSHETINHSMNNSTRLCLEKGSCSN